MHIFFSVGEPSGDQHAACLIQELRKRMSHLHVSGFGGPRMEEVGLASHYRLTDLAVMGFFRVIPLIWKFYGLYRRAARLLREQRPDAVVLVDFPGFNWWIARAAKREGIRVFYYLPPQLWAWAPWRIRRIRKHVDHVLCGLSFEHQWYTDRGVSAEYVGHPFFDEIQGHRLDEHFLAVWGDSADRTVGAGRTIGMLPGSRNHEVEQNWPIMIACMKRLAAQRPELRFLVACFNESHRNRCEHLWHQAAGNQADVSVHFHVGKTPEIIEVADCCLMVSGSVSLEMLARGTPAVVIYYFGTLTGVLARLLVRCKFASLPNLMVDRELLPEFFPQGKATATIEAITSHLSNWLGDPAELDRIKTELFQLRGEVMRTGAIARAAAAIEGHLQAPAMGRAA